MTNEVFPIQKNNPIRDRKYLDSYRGEKCFIPDCFDCETTVGSHIRSGLEGGTAFKPSDDLTICLCYKHHCESAKNEKKFWKKYGYTISQIKKIARSNYKAWKANRLLF